MYGFCNYLIRSRTILAKSPHIFQHLPTQPQKILPVIFSCNFGTVGVKSDPESPVLTKLEVDLHFEKKKIMDPTRYNLQSAVLRYKLGEDRFQFSFVLNSGKVFNFDRCVSETLESFEVRIRSNMLKKFKAAEITAKLILPSEFQPTDALLPFLQHLVSESGQLQFQINNEPITVDVNPPEIFAIKFLDKALAGFPFHPFKVEHSENMRLEGSQFLWEYTKDREAVEPSGKMPKKGKRPDPRSEKWGPCGDQMILYPEATLTGAHLRMTCTPSDGKRLGPPFTAEVSQPVRSLPVSKLLYEELLERLDSVPEDPHVLRFVSYNILADVCATPEWFFNSPPEALDYSYRMPILEKELASYNADVLCLQEVEEKTFEGVLEPFLRQTKNLRGILCCKTGNAKDGVATFYNPQKLNLLQSEAVELSAALKSLPLWDHVKTLESVVTRIEDRKTVLQLLVLETKSEDRSIVLLGVTHLYFHPNADHIRLLQTMACIRSIESKQEELRQLYPDRVVRVFFAGDFNCTPPYSSFRLLKTGRIEANDEDWICHDPEKISPGIEFSHHLGLTNSHPGEELTNITMCFEGCLDYIWFQPDTTQIIKSYPPPDKATIGSISGCNDYQVSLPNLQTVSDHLPLIADFKLKK